MLITGSQTFTTQDIVNLKYVIGKRWAKKQEKQHILGNKEHREKNKKKMHKKKNKTKQNKQKTKQKNKEKTGRYYTFVVVD